jgi:GT2 family glycosyltransferase
MTPVVSIVIPSYKRKESLQKLLKSLSIEKNNYLEIIVVLQEEKNIRSHGKVKVYYLSKPSTPHAMNIGAKMAKGDLIIFLDDDVLVRKSLIVNHVINFLDPNIAATCGRVITLGQSIEPYHRRVGRIGPLGGVSGGFSSTIRQEVDTVIGCNTCWNKSVYLSLKGIDEQFTGNAIRLETDLSLRAKKRGYKIVFEPKAIVIHNRAVSGGARKSEGRLHWYFDFFSNETYFFLKHQQHIFLPIFWLTKIEWALRCMFGFGREVSIRSILTPFAGMADGVRKYKAFLQNL